MEFNYRACGCRVCTRRAELQEVQEFTRTATIFRDLMHATFAPDEEANLRLLARKVEANVSILDVERVHALPTAPPLEAPHPAFCVCTRCTGFFPHPLEPPEGWCSA